MMSHLLQLLKSNRDYWIISSFIQFLLQCFSKQILVVLATPSLSILPSFLLKESWFVFSFLHFLDYFNHQLILHSPTMDERSVVIVTHDYQDHS